MFVPRTHRYEFVRQTVLVCFVISCLCCGSALSETALFFTSLNLSNLFGVLLVASTWECFLLNTLLPFSAAPECLTYCRHVFSAL